jgi:hypothetical protein
MEQEQMAVFNKSTYTEAAKNAIYKYRSKNIEKYNEKQREYYEKSKQDEEWKQHFNERCRIANKKYREKKREILGENKKSRGRPRKHIVIKINEIY